MTTGDVLTRLVRSIEHYFLIGLKRDISRYPISYEGVRSGSLDGIVPVVNLLILAQVECERSDVFLQGLLGLSEPTKAYIARVVEEFKTDDRVRYLEYYEGVCSSAILNNSGSTGIEYDRENRQHFADKDRMIEDQNRLITTLQTRLDEYQKRLADRDTEISSNHAGVVETYLSNIAYLEDQVRRLTERSARVSELEGELITMGDLARSLREANQDLESRLRSAGASSDNLPVELDEFLESGGTCSGRVRDRVILTLKEQLAVRDEEINFLREERSKLSDQFKKTEKLLVSSIHSIALRYHEEMVSSGDNRDVVPSDSMSTSIGHENPSLPHGG